MLSLKINGKLNTPILYINNQVTFSIVQLQTEASVPLYSHTHALQGQCHTIMPPGLTPEKELMGRASEDCDSEVHKVNVTTTPRTKNIQSVIYGGKM